MRIFLPSKYIHLLMQAVQYLFNPVNWRHFTIKRQSKSHHYTLGGGGGISPPIPLADYAPDIRQGGGSLSQPLSCPCYTPGGGGRDPESPLIYVIVCIVKQGLARIILPYIRFKVLWFRKGLSNVKYKMLSLCFFKLYSTARCVIS